jgi:Pyruvate/2-oxoacid:ferredoxin oxidoreductase gamma subunit
MDRELMLTGIGGQGVQLAAQTLARGATLDGRYAILLGTYGGTMRGGNTDSTLVFGERPISSPPIVSRTWSAIALHHRFWAPMRQKLRSGGILLVDATIFQGELDRDSHRVFEIPATEIAAGLGSQMGAAMVMVAAYARLTGIVGIESLVKAMSSALPAYRRQHLPVNIKLLHAGFDLFETMAAPAWCAAEGAA